MRGILTSKIRQTFFLTVLACAFASSITRRSWPAKNVWLLTQAFFIALCFIGLVMAFNSERHALSLATQLAIRS